MSPEIRSAASGAALAAEAAALGLRPPELIKRRLTASLQAFAATTGDSLPGRTWRAISPEVRTTLVMLGSSASGDARRLAQQPWESFSDADRASMGAIARQFARDLRDAACLW